MEVVDVDAALERLERLQTAAIRVVLAWHEGEWGAVESAVLGLADELNRESRGV